MVPVHGSPYRVGTMEPYRNGHGSEPYGNHGTIPLSRPCQPAPPGRLHGPLRAPHPAAVTACALVGPWPPFRRFAPASEPRSTRVEPPERTPKGQEAGMGGQGGSQGRQEREPGGPQEAKEMPAIVQVAIVTSRDASMAHQHLVKAALHSPAQTTQAPDRADPITDCRISQGRLDFQGKCRSVRTKIDLAPCVFSGLHPGRPQAVAACACRSMLLSDCKDRT